MSQLTFSAVTICLNHAEFIRDTIESVLTQDWSSCEHIIVDGGSTDGTLDIIRECAHLKWTSEHDTGISNALNNGFARASGDVIAWINSDDYYLPGAFATVAPLLEKHPIVFGDALEVNRTKEFVRRHHNLPRSYYDLLRYWVPSAWFAQPAIFFRRDALEKVRLDPHQYLDESFGYSMDYELWLRFALEFSFSHYVRKDLAAFRVYGENKTGSTLATPQREMGRAFKRSVNTVVKVERPITILLPVSQLSQDITESIRSVMSQEYLDFELVLIDQTHDNEATTLLKKAARELEEISTHFRTRYVKVAATTYFGAIQEVLPEIFSGLFFLLRPGDVLKPETLTQVVSLMAHDPYGALLLIEDHEQARSMRLPETSQLDVNALLGLEDDAVPCVVRGVVLRELGGFRWTKAPLIPFRDLLMRIVNRAWGVQVSTDIQLESRATPSATDRERCQVFRNFAHGHLIVETYEDACRDEFYPVRRDNRVAPEYPVDTVETARRFSALLPAKWAELDFAGDVEKLERMTAEYPHFAPGWLLLAEAYEAGGRGDEARGVMTRLRGVSDRVVT